MNSQATGVFVSLAWPDTFVSTSGGKLERFVQMLGGGKESKFKAGHAALALIERSTGIVEFFDFGRYITPDGKARVRSAKTDPEVGIELRAKFDDTGKITNLNDVLIRLESDPEATHGEGRMLASFCYEINYEKAKDYITTLQNKGSIDYGPFANPGSNCSRFVADSFKAGTLNNRLKLRHKFTMTITPSPIGNVVNGTPDKEMWEVYEGKVKAYPGSRRKTAIELIVNTFGKDSDIGEVNLIGNMIEPERPSQIPVKAQWLNGRGAGAWFDIQYANGVVSNEFRVQRYTPDGKVGYDNVFKLSNGKLDLDQPYTFVYDCHATQTTIIQSDEKLILKTAL